MEKYAEKYVEKYVEKYAEKYVEKYAGRGWYPEHFVHHKITKQITKVFSSNYYVVVLSGIWIKATIQVRQEARYQHERQSGSVILTLKGPWGKEFILYK